MWSILFFGMQEIGFALVDIVFLDIAVFVTLVLFRRLDPLAASMLAPYLGWLLFATALNLRIFQLNN
jgi:tryptophan-rich sensory protein